VKQSVGLRGTIAGNDVEWLVGTQFRPKRKEKVQKLFVDAFDLIRSVVAQNVVDFSQRLRKVLPLHPINRFQLLSCMGVVEG
jgi:hypothetical protein